MVNYIGEVTPAGRCCYTFNSSVADVFGLYNGTKTDYVTYETTAGRPWVGAHGKFNGLGDDGFAAWVSVSQTNNWRPTTKGTWAFWMKANNDGDTDRTIWTNWYSGWYGWMIRMHSGVLQLLASPDDHGAYTFESSGTVNDNAWHWHTIVFDASTSTTSFYKDGALVVADASSPAWTADKAITYTANMNGFIGVRQDSTNKQDYLSHNSSVNAYLKDMWIADMAPNAPQVRWLYGIITKGLY